MDFHGVVDKTKNFFQKLGRRNLIIICSLVLICTAVYLNWRFFSGETPEGSSNGGIYSDGTIDGISDSGRDAGSDLLNSANDPVDSYFAASQISRQRARDEAMEVLQSVAGNGEATETIKNQALEDISRIALDIERESNIESLILSKGFDQCVAIVNGGTANVIVKCDTLLPNQMSQIYEIVYDQAGIEPVNVRIIPKSEA